VAALFPPVANQIYRATLIVLGLVAVLVVISPMIWIRTPYAGDTHDALQQPIEFDHRHHVRDDGIDCVYCHDTVETDAYAGLPSTERCMGCHGQIWPDSPELAPLHESWRRHTPIRWKRLNALPAYVFFHHGVHVQAGIKCDTCHGPVEDMGRVWRAHNLTMDFCMECHRKYAGRSINRLTTCTACHR
jgi:hypothetical protein